MDIICVLFKPKAVSFNLGSINVDLALILFPSNDPNRLDTAFNNVLFKEYPVVVIGFMFPRVNCSPRINGITIDKVGYISPDNSVVMLSNGFKSGIQSSINSHSTAAKPFGARDSEVREAD